MSLEFGRAEAGLSRPGKAWGEAGQDKEHGSSGPEERFGEPPLRSFPDYEDQLLGPVLISSAEARKHLKRGFEEFLILTPKRGAPLTAVGIK